VRFSASLYSVDCGATTSTVKKVFILDSKFNNDVEIFIADNVDDIEIEWVAMDTLLIRYNSARVFLKKDYYSFDDKKIFLLFKEKE
jgi:hypothetical protein